jgi:hypothetical protein
MAKKTYHAKDGRFTSFNRANVVNQGGERFKLVRTLEPLDPPKEPEPTPADASTAEGVTQVKQKVHDLAARIAPQWIALDEVVK